MERFLDKVVALDKNTMFEYPIARTTFGDPAQADEYFAMVKRPMAFQLVRTALADGIYDKDPAAFLRDLALP